MSDPRRHEVMLTDDELRLIEKRREREQAINDGFPVDTQDDIEEYWSERMERENESSGWRDVPICNEAGEIIDTGGWGI